MSIEEGKGKLVSVEVSIVVRDGYFNSIASCRHELSRRVDTFEPLKDLQSLMGHVAHVAERGALGACMSDGFSRAFGPSYDPVVQAKSEEEVLDP